MMVRQILTAFFGGELSGWMMGRVDTEQYAYGLAVCENFVAVNEGPLVKRPGFAYVCDADPTSSWLSAFRFSISQEYLLEWGEQKLRFYTNGVQIEATPGVPYEVETPYPAAFASQLSMQQSYDRLYLNHGNYPPAALSRTGALTFSFATRTLTGGPFVDQNIDEAKTVLASGTDGSITINANASIFEVGHVGAVLRIEAKDFSDIPAWEAGMKDVVVGAIVRSDGKAYQATTAGTTGTIQPTHTIGAEWDGSNRKDLANDKGPYGVKWQYLHGRFGIVRIAGFTSPTSITALVINRLPNSVTTVATHRWSHAAFSAARGWPHLITHWAGRQIHFMNFDIIGSVVGDLSNYASTTSSGQVTPDMGFRRTLATDNPPLWCAGDNKKLIVGAAASELGIGAINTAQAIAGDNISSEPQSFYGCDPVFPLQVGTETIFIERGGRRVRAASYDFSRDRYVAPDLTAASRHITKGGVVQMVHHKMPHSLLYGVRADGQMIVHALTRAEVKGFARCVVGGGAKILSAAAIFDADGRRDELWVLIERTTPMGVRREIWRQEPWWDTGDDQRQAFFVDAGVRIAAAAGQTVFSGLSHLSEQAVDVLANGGVISGLTVDSDGTLTLPTSAVPSFPFPVIVGLPYTARAVTLRQEVKTEGRTVQGVRQRLKKVGLRLMETLGMRVGPDGGDTEEVIDRTGNAEMDSAIALKTGDVEGHVDMEFDRNGQVQFVSDVPLPATVNAVMLNIDVSSTNV